MNGNIHNIFSFLIRQLIGSSELGVKTQPTTHTRLPEPVPAVRRENLPACTQLQLYVRGLPLPSLLLGLDRGFRGSCFIVRFSRYLRSGGGTVLRVERPISAHSGGGVTAGIGCGPSPIRANSNLGPVGLFHSPRTAG